jgi:hypothetical protein
MARKTKRVNAASQLVEDPKFLFRVSKKIAELGVVGERQNCLTVFLAGLTTFMDRERRVSVMATGPSGSGKTTLIESPHKLFPTDLVIKRASFSRQALAYGVDSLEHKILYVNEYRGTKSEAQFLLRLLQSEGEISREFAMRGKTDVARRLGLPVVMTTTTAETVCEDDATRFLMLAIDDTSEQTLAVFKAELGMKPSSQELPLEVWQEAVGLLRQRYSPFGFPGWFEFVAEQVPKDQVRARRDWKRLMGLMEAVALCRPNSESEKQITIEDYCIAYMILNPALTATNYVVSESELQVQKAVRDLHKKLGRAVTIDEVKDHVGLAYGVAYKYVGKAIKHHLIEHESGTREKNKKPLLPIGNESGSFLPHPNMDPRAREGAEGTGEIDQSFHGRVENCQTSSEWKSGIMLHCNIGTGAKCQQCQIASTSRICVTPAS